MDMPKGFKSESIMTCTLKDDGYWETLLKEVHYVSLDLVDWTSREAVMKVIEKDAGKSIDRARELMDMRLKKCGGTLFNEA